MRWARNGERFGRKSKYKSLTKKKKIKHRRRKPNHRLKAIFFFFFLKTRTFLNDKRNDKMEIFHSHLLCIVQLAQHFSVHRLFSIAAFDSIYPVDRYLSRFLIDLLTSFVWTHHSSSFSFVATKYDFSSISLAHLVFILLCFNLYFVCTSIHWHIFHLVIPMLNWAMVNCSFLMLIWCEEMFFSFSFSFLFFLLSQLIYAIINSLLYWIFSQWFCLIQFKKPTIKIHERKINSFSCHVWENYRKY